MEFYIYSIGITGAADVPDIVFPGPKVGDNDNLRPQTLKDGCDKRKTFCEAVPNYPYNDIAQALKKSVGTN